MILLDARLAVLSAAAPEWLRVPSGESDESAYTGRYLCINDRPYALGRELGRGEEAIVLELIDLRTGEFDYVVKVCRHRPGTERFARWAVPVRFQRNPGAPIPDIEMYPCQLIEIPGGGVVKVQRYLSTHPQSDWTSRLPARLLAKEAYEHGIASAVESIEALIAEHGEEPALLEFKGRIAAEQDELDDALTLFTRALASFVATNTSSKYCTSICLAETMEAIYERDRSRGDAELSVTLDDGTVLRNTFFAESTAAATDDSLQDRGCFAVVDVMTDLPYFVGGLNFIQESLLSLSGGWAFTMASRAVAAVDPLNPLLGQLNEARIWPREPTAEAPQTHRSDDRAPPDGVDDALSEHSLHYEPQVVGLQSGRSLVDSAMVDVQRGREEVAESSLRQAVSVGPDVAGYRVALATFLTARGRNDEAALELMRGVEACPGEPQLRLLLGSALVRCRRLDEAERVLLRARPLLPDDVHDIDLLLAEVDAYRKS